MKFKAKVKDCQLIVRGKTTPGEMIDEREFDRFSRTAMRGFLKPRRVKKNQIEFTGPVGLSLYERLKYPIGKRDFLYIVEQTVVAVQNLDTNHFSVGNLIMSVQNVYINRVTKELHFIYFPTTAGQNETNIISFFEAIVYSAHPADESDNEFVARFVRYFKSLKPLDSNKLEDWVRHEDSSVVREFKRGGSGFITDKPRNYYSHYAQDEPLDMRGDEPTGLLSDEGEPTGLLGGESEETGLLYDESEETTLLCEDRPPVHYPTLFRVATNEEIPINQPVFRLGKERQYVNYFVTNNAAVSRKHADIYIQGNRFFVKDLNSKNHTFINGEEIPANYKVEIKNGDSLRLGNEEFIFRA